MKKMIAVCLAAAMVLGSVTALSAGAQAQVKMGDADLNGTVNVVDATTIQMAVAEKITLSPTQKAVADVNKNGEVDVSDATTVQRIAAEQIVMDEMIDPIPEPTTEAPTTEAPTTEPEPELTPEQVKTQGSLAQNDFAVRLLQGSVKSGENTMVSPLSVLYALGMTANGAKGKTLSEMEAALGMKRGLLNAYLKAYPTYCTDDGDSEKEKVSIANSIWYNTAENAPQISGSFLNTVDAYYGAEVYPTLFDSAALNSINGWVKEKTDSMIPKIIDEIDPTALMYLINAVCFDAKWSSPYATETVYRDYFSGENVVVGNGDIIKDAFTAENGDKTTVKYMRSTEHNYIKDTNAQGFVKTYRGGNYAFAAILPDEGVKLGDYLNSLTGEKLTSLLAKRQTIVADIHTRLPEFELEYSDSLVDNLQALGMTDAFTGKADFRDMLADANADSPCISEVLHKTFIAVTPEGTRAAAVTAVVEGATSAPEEEPPKYIFLDRPFLYMIFNTNTNTPLFIGTVEALPDAE